MKNACPGDQTLFFRAFALLLDQKRGGTPF